jgi:hypothetical protein
VLALGGPIVFKTILEPFGSVPWPNKRGGLILDTGWGDRRTTIKNEILIFCDQKRAAVFGLCTFKLKQLPAELKENPKFVSCSAGEAALAIEICLRLSFDSRYSNHFEVAPRLGPVSKYWHHFSERWVFSKHLIKFHLIFQCHPNGTKILKCST